MELTKEQRKELVKYMSCHSRLIATFIPCSDKFELFFRLEKGGLSVCLDIDDEQVILLLKDICATQNRVLKPQLDFLKSIGVEDV